MGNVNNFLKKPDYGWTDEESLGAKVREGGTKRNFSHFKMREN